MSSAIRSNRAKSTFLARPLAITLGCMSALYAAHVDAGAREQAKRMHDRLVGVPPTSEVLDQMESLIDANNLSGAAELAMQNENFYNVTLKNFATPWTNEAQSVFVSLNDYTATVIGLIRDDSDFRTVLFDDVIYQGSASLGLPTYGLDNNNHYEQLESNRYDLSDSNVLVRATQSNVNNLPAEATAGVMTSRAAAQAFFSGGTNRAMLRFTLMNHLCRDMEQMKDGSLPPDRIRQDVSRSPGGNSSIFLNTCMECHAGMDPMAQAFAYYDFNYDMVNDPTAEDGQLEYNDVGQTDPVTGTRVQEKYHINSTTFPYGFVTPDDRWDNYWREGAHQGIWDTDAEPNTSGNGAKSLGRQLAYSHAFAQCQATKVFENVCLRSPQDATDRTQIDAMVSNLEASSFRMKGAFSDAAVYCRGE